MSTSLDTIPSFLLPIIASGLPARMVMPAIIADAGDHAAGRFVESFTTTVDLALYKSGKAYLRLLGEVYAPNHEQNSATSSNVGPGALLLMSKP